jgi:Putative beta barrel porin-7 (BBP7)
MPPVVGLYAIVLASGLVPGQSAPNQADQPAAVVLGRPAALVQAPPGPSWRACSPDQPDLPAPWTTGRRQPAVSLGQPMAASDNASERASVNPPEGNGVLLAGFSAAAPGRPTGETSIAGPNLLRTAFDQEPFDPSAYQGDGPNGCCPGNTCPTGAGACPKFWIVPEYMLFWVKNGPLAAPLATTTTPTAFATLPNAGGVGVPGTTVLFGHSMDYGDLNGARLTVGGWLDPDNMSGFNARLFGLEQGGVRALFASNAAGNPPLSVPINLINYAGNPFTPGPSAFFLSSPAPAGGLPLAGDISIVSRSQLWGGEANGQVNVVRENWLELNALAGLRYLNLREDLTLLTHSSSVPGDAASVLAFGSTGVFGGSLTTADTWRTRNQFYGGQVGAQADMTFGNFFVNLTGKLAMGFTHQEVNVGGITSFNNTGLIPSPGVPAGVTTLPGGILNFGSNGGKQTRNDFSVVPEVELQLGYAITSNVKIFVGYNATYWTNVARPGDQINNSVDLRQVPSLFTFTPGLPRLQPFPVFRTSDFWAQGITAGVAFSF